MLFQIFIIFSVLNIIKSAPSESFQLLENDSELLTLDKLKFNTNLRQIVHEYQHLEKKLPKKQLRSITIIGILNGAIIAEKNLEKYLTENVADLILNLNMENYQETLNKIHKIEKLIERDHSAIQILGITIDLAKESITNSQYQNQMKQTFHEFHQKQAKILTKNKLIQSNSNQDQNQQIQERLDALKINILEHLNQMQYLIQDKTNATLLYLYKIHQINDSASQLTTDNIKEIHPKHSDIIRSILLDSIEKNLVPITRREDFEEFPTRNRNKTKSKSNNQETLSENTDNDMPDTTDTPSAGGAGGGITGLIASLSGGEEGSDIGALLGALTGLVSQLFGPNGLDVPSLISSTTSLLAGLLSGGKNFGLVLGEYFGLALDGLSGGGGAINNGKFLGNLLGTMFATLSADPEDDDEPPKPQIFFDNFIKTFLKNARNQKSASSSDEDDDNSTKEDDDDTNNASHKGGSDSFSFIKHIAQTVVSGVTRLILNASAGSSSGLSDGSSGVFKSAASAASGASSSSSNH